jgi:hypothetical protein
MRVRNPARQPTGPEGKVVAGIASSTRETERIAWRLQSLAEGTLSERARKRAEELARDADLRTTLPRPPKEASGAKTVALPAPKLTAHDRLPLPGTVLTRRYRARRVEAKVLPQGFEYEGQVYRSLSAVAEAVTGSHWNGHLFFGLTAGTKKDNR